MSAAVRASCGTRLTGQDLLTSRQRDRLLGPFDTSQQGDDRLQVEVTWSIYQQIVAAYREQDKNRGKMIMNQVIGTTVRRCRRPSSRSATRPHPGGQGQAM